MKGHITKMHQLKEKDLKDEEEKKVSKEDEFSIAKEARKEVNNLINDLIDLEDERA